MEKKKNKFKNRNKTKSKKEIIYNEKYKRKKGWVRIINVNGRFGFEI
jgi:hypothetical protein